MPDVTAAIVTLVLVLSIVMLGRLLRRRRRHQLARLREDFVPDWVYFVWPGWVTSVTDRDRHWISADRLIRLYRVDPRVCRVLHPDDPSVGSLLRRYPYIPVLRPRPDGDYRVPR